jgi:hypothetical protein
MDVFRRLLTGTDALTKIGLAGGIPGSYALIRHGEGLPALIAGERTAPDFDSEESQDCWVFLVRSSLRFMYFHEIGHLRSGHVAGRVAADSRIRRARELEADHAGALAAIQLLVEEDGTQRPVDVHRLYLWGFAIGILFGLIEKLSEDDTQHGRRLNPIDGVNPYPRGGLRGFWATQALAVRDPHGQDEELRIVSDRIIEGFEGAREAWEQIGWGKLERHKDEEIIEIGDLMRLLEE